MTRETCPEAVYCKCSLGILTELRDVCEDRRASPRQRRQIKASLSAASAPSANHCWIFPRFGNTTVKTWRCFRLHHTNKALTADPPRSSQHKTSRAGLLLILPEAGAACDKGKSVRSSFSIFLVLPLPCPNPRRPPPFFVFFLASAHQSSIFQFPRDTGIWQQDFTTPGLHKELMRRI